MKIAAIQAAPVFLNPQETTDKALTLMREAADNGAELAAFPEVFISGYPLWLRPLLSNLPDDRAKAAHAAYVRAGIAADGPELAAIADEARQLGLFTYVGFIERASNGGSVYCSLAAVHPERGIVGVHRKVKPTSLERIIWSDGDSHGLRVHEWKGLHVGGLNCFENWQPVIRHALYAQGEQLHVACWPGRKNHAVDIARFIAMEGRVYVLSVGGVIGHKDIPNSFPLKDEPGLEAGFQVMTGGAMVVAPDGTVLCEPVADEETIVYADIDPEETFAQRDRLDPAGHYFRPDLFSVRVDFSRHAPIHERAAD